MRKQMGRMIYMTEAPVSSEKLCKNEKPQTKRKSRVYAKKNILFLTFVLRHSEQTGESTEADNFLRTLHQS